MEQEENQQQEETATTSVMTERARQSCYEIVKISLGSARVWLSQEQEGRISQESKDDLYRKINEAELHLVSLSPLTFDIEQMLESDTGEILFNCLEFYGQHLNTTLNFVSGMYRTVCQAKFGMSPEELEEQAEMQQMQEQITNQQQEEVETSPS